MSTLGERFRVVAVDLPGQGDSDRPLDGYDTLTVAGRVHNFFDHLGLRRYAVAAHDVGAWVAFPYAHMLDRQVEAVALLDAGIPSIMLPSAPDKAWKTWHFTFRVLPDLPKMLIAGRERAYLE